MSLVVVDYNELTAQNTSDELCSKIEEAYGQGLGVIGIKNVPEFVKCKEAVLTQAHKLAHLPKDELLKLEDEKSMYNAGWSHGKEKLGDTPDTAKASFYFNPLTDTPGTAEERKQYPSSYPCNVWPTDSMPQFEPAAKKLGKVMHGCVVHLSRHIDACVARKLEDYPKNLLSTEIAATEKAKGRLLYYFPMEKKSGPKSWIGWHNDSGFLTSLAGDMYVNDETGEVIECPDPEAGLYVINREGVEVKVDIPADCMAVQLGECVQIITGGVLTATPHYVKGARQLSDVKVARISHPCFIDTPPGFVLNFPPSCKLEKALHTSDKVPALKERIHASGVPFGDFLSKTFEMYYEHNKKAFL